jgi:regulatory protein
LAAPLVQPFPLEGRLWHKNGVNSRFKARRAPTPVNSTALEELALCYVGKYATTRAKLRTYLARKVRERGWDGAATPDFEALANRFAELGYIDDAGYALSKSKSLSARGYGKRRLAEKLRLAGVDEPDRAAANEHAEAEAIDAALRFAERRRLGPFAASGADQRQREKWIAAMVRAGHGFGVARAIAGLRQGDEIDVEALRNRTETPER